MLYTRVGDDGTTGLFGSSVRLSKAAPVAEALGTLDELNSFLGLVRAELARSGGMRVPVGERGTSAETLLLHMQDTLFTIQAELAGAPKHVRKSKVAELERMTDSIERILQPLHSFSLAGGTYRSALFDVARTLARRAERRVVAVSGEKPARATHTLSYLNRLSSALFALSRLANHLAGVSERAPNYT